MCSQLFSSAAVLILTAALCFSTLAEARCNQDGWFANCQYKCHCAQSTPCDKVDGSCSSGCDPQWFGPACQYASIRLNESNWLTDNDDSTCYPDNGGTSIDLYLATPVPLTWIRVVHKGNVNELRIMYKKDEQSSNQSCPDNANVAVDDHTMDFICTTSHTVQQIIVDNDSGSFQSLCSLYISGGRNVALKQRTRQSSRFQQSGARWISWYPRYAVDGFLPGSSIESTYLTCTHNYLGQVLNWWTVEFNTSVDVTRILIYNRPILMDRLKKFTLTALQNGSELYKVTGPDEAREMYSVVPSPKISSAVTEIKIQSRQDEILTLCEVEVFGELRCPTGRFGLACKRECHCDSQTNCFVHSGRCKAGCAPGYGGATCSECQSGKYGLGCLQNCSQNCKACSRIDGICLGRCRDGYTGFKCEHKCLIGTYGAGCSKTCSEHCKSTSIIKACNHTNGKCDGRCEDGYTEDTCQSKCPPGKFGAECSLDCSPHCKGGNTSCDHVNGSCSDGCFAGYKGQNCTSSQSNDEPGKLLIGIAVLVLVPAVAIALSFFLGNGKGGSVSNNLPREAGDTNTRSFRETNQRDKNNSNSVDPSVPSSSQSTGASPGVESAQPGELSAASTSVTRPLRGNTAVCVENLKNYILQHSTDSHFEEEFSSVPMTSGSPQTQGTLPENVKKNRYKNIIPYDESRVLLETVVGKKHTDYINASYVQGYKGTKTFIASQGPTDPLLDDFVRMLWERRVDKIVMLTNLVEEGKKKCSMYWPEDVEKQFDGITMKLLTVHIFAEYTIRNLRLSKKGEPFRYLTQFHFTAWPDRSVPESPWGLVDLYQRVTAAQGEGPVLVHCSAGVGRTGTFIGLCNLLQETKATGKMDFYSTLWNLRQCRKQTLQTLEQYICLHHAALVGHVISETTLKEDDIVQRLSSLEENGIAHDYKQEFEALVEVCDATSSKQNEPPADEQNKSVYQNMKDVTNTSKDRLGNISPNPSFRAELIADSRHKDTYINAVLVPNMIKDRQDILTQLPMAATVTDFWRLVTQFNVGLVVAFDTDLKDTDESIVDFFNMTVKERFEKDGFIIETKTSEESKLVTEFSLIVQQKSKRAKRPLPLLLCKIREMETRSLYKLQEKILSRRPMKSSRTVYMCRNGADKCGLVCIQPILLERMKQDHCLSVPLVVGKIKAIRPQVIPTVEQYKSLYLMLKLAHESQNVYSNVGASSC